MKFFATLLILFASVFMSCNTIVTGIRKNENINPEVRSEIKKLDELVMQKIFAADSNGLMSLCSEKTLAVSRKDIGILIRTLNQKIHKNNFTAFNNYHSVNAVPNGTVFIPVDLSSAGGYTLRYTSATKESCLSQYLVSDSISSDFMLTIFYTQGKDKWEISLIQFYLYRICGKTAPELLADAKSSYANNNLVDAVNYATLTQYIARPGENAWIYAHEEDMRTFYNKVYEEAKQRFDFPIALPEIKTAPKIIGFSPKPTDIGILPLISYQSTVPLADTNALKEEYRAIRAESVNIFEGLNRDNKFVCYKAFNELPGDKKEVPVFVFIDTIRINK